MTEILIYLTLSIAWGVGGFTGGYILGARGRKKLAEVFTPADPEERTVTSPISDKPRTTAGLPWYRRTQVWLGLTVVFLGAGTVTQGFVLGGRTNDVVQCQHAWSAGFSQALAVNREAARETAIQSDLLWKKIYEAFQSPTPQWRAEFGGLLRDYLAAREKASDNPAPPAPSEFCNGE